MAQVLIGILLMGYGISGLFFFRFWNQTRDRLFLMFGIAFFILCLQELLFGISSQPDEDLTYLFIIRLIAFILILIAIVDKNLGRSQRTR
jgi:hypothetical protein